MLEVGQEWVLHTSPFRLKETTTPTNAEIPSNVVGLYAKDSSGTSTLCYKNDAGTEICLPTVGPLVTGSGVANQLAIWSGTSTLIGDTDLTFVTDTLTATKIVGSTSITTPALTDSSMTLGSVLFAGTGGLISQDNANFFWDDASNFLGLGTAGPANKLHISADNFSGALIDGLVTVFAPTFMGRGFRTSAAAPSAVTTNDTLAHFTGAGRATTLYTGGKASIVMSAGEAWTDTANGSYITLATTALLSTTRTERFRVGPSGQWGIGGATFGTATNVFKSGGASAAPTWGTVAASEVTSGAAVTAASTKITLAGTPSTAGLTAFSIDVNQANLDHGSIGGLADDDHVGYALLAGRSGGQTLIGGTAAADALTLRATAGVGAGSEAIILQVGSNGALEGLRVGQANSQSVVAIGTSALSITNASTLNPRLIISGAGVAHNVQVIRHTTVGAGGAIFSLSTTRGAGANTHSALQAGDGLGTYYFEGSDGVRFITAASIRAVVETTFTTDSAIARLDFATNNGSSPSNPPVSMSLSSVGVLSISRTTGQIDLSAISAGSPNFKITKTSDTPTVVFTAGVPSTNPQGLMEIDDGSGTPGYFPYWR